jgi:hypothetical protein
MPRRHIACQAARLIRNKCRGRVTQRPYVKLRPLAYVTRSRPRGSIGSLPGRGAEAYTDRSAPDWVLTRVSTGPPPGSLGPRCGWPRPITGVQTPSNPIPLWVAYVTRSRPRGSIGSLPGRGAEAYTDRSAPDWVLTRVSTGPPPGSLGPRCGWPRPITGVQTPSQGSSLHTWRAGTNPGGPDCIPGGPRPTLGVRTIYLGVRRSPEGSEPLLMPWSIPPSLDTWRL